MTDISTLNNQYKLDSLGLLPDYCLQEIFNREVNNSMAGKILILLSGPTRQKVLSNFNSVRSARISSIIDKYESGDLSIPFPSFVKTCESLLDRVQNLKDQGAIHIPQLGLDESFFDSNDELNSFSDNLPGFNFYHNDLHDLISWWNLAAKNIKSLYGKRIQAENIVLERLDDEFSSTIFALSIDDIKDNEFIEQTTELRKRIQNDYFTRINLIEKFLLNLLHGESNKLLAADLADNFPDADSIEKRLTAHAPLLLVPAIKDRLPAEDIAMSLYKLKIIYNEGGADELEKYTRKVDDHYLRKGLSIILSKMDHKFAETIIRERKKAQLAEIEIKLKMITDAVTCIRNNISSYIMLELMSSYTVYDFEE